MQLAALGRVAEPPVPAEHGRVDGVEVGDLDRADHLATRRHRHHDPVAVTLDVDRAVDEGAAESARHLVDGTVDDGLGDDVARQHGIAPADGEGGQRERAHRARRRLEHDQPGVTGNGP